MEKKSLKSVQHTIYVVIRNQENFGKISSWDHIKYYFTIENASNRLVLKYKESFHYVKP